MAVAVSTALVPLEAISVYGVSVGKISVGDQLVWEPTVPNNQVSYAVPFAVVGEDAPPPPPSLSLHSATSDSLSVVAAGPSGFRFNFYLNGARDNSTPVVDSLYTYEDLDDGIEYELSFSFVNDAGTSSPRYGSFSASTIELSHELPQASRDAIDAFVAAKLKPLTKVDGALVGISTPDVSYFKAFGGDRTAGLALTLDHKMRYGSISKMYTAIMILNRVKDGLLSLDDKLAYFDRTDMVLSTIPNAEKVTIRQLLMMTSGIKDYLQQDAAVQQTYFLSPTAAFDPMPYIRSYPPLFEPGTQSSYSNSNTVLLGKILEWVDAEHGTGRDVRTILAEDCFAPLGLSNTEWPTGNYMTAPYSRGWADNLALPAIEAMLGPLAFLAGLLGYQTTAEIEWTAVNTAYSGTSGSLDGTIADLVKFGEAIASGALLSPELVQRRNEEFVTYLTYVPASPWEGPGWMGFGLGVIQWGSWLGWIGNLGGYLSVMFANPTNGAVIAVIMNHMQSNPLDVFYRIAYLLFPETTLAAEQIIRVETTPSTSEVREPAVYVWHAPGDEDGKTDVPLKVPFYI